MTTLLTLVQQQAIKPISNNNTAKYDLIAKEVENLELRNLIGISLLQDIQANPNTVLNKKLLDKTTFVDANNISITHQGLRFILAYFNYIRYIGDSFINDTFTGFVQKNRPDSSNITEGTIKRLQQESKDIALSEWEIIKLYLELNRSSYPLYNESKTFKVYRPKFTGIRTTQQ